MKRKRRIIVILMMTIALLVVQHHSEVFACYVACPNDVQLQPGNGEYTFTYKLDRCTYKWHKYISIQMDSNIPCDNTGNDGSQCSNIRVLLNNEDVDYYVSRPKDLIGSCNNDFTTYPGPRPSYVITIEKPDNVNSYNCETDEVLNNLSNMPVLQLIVKTTKELALGNGNVVITDINARCTSCKYDTPVVVNELGTLRQGIKLRPDCTVYYRFDAEGNPLPAKRSDLVGQCIGLKGISRPFANNEIALRILRNPQDTEKADAIVSENYSKDFIINFVKTTTTNSIPFSLKTGDDSQYWYYLPGYGWQVIYY